MSLLSRLFFPVSSSRFYKQDFKPRKTHFLKSDQLQLSYTRFDHDICQGPLTIPANFFKAFAASFSVPD